MSAAVITTATIVDDAALIRAAQQGDEDAFGELVRSHDEGVLRLAMNLLRSPEDARDVYQEAFLRVYRNLSNFRFDCSFHTWLYRIVTNLCLDHLRKRKVRREESPVVETEDGVRNRMDVAPESWAGSDPERTLLSAEIGERIERVLAALTPRERLVFELRHYQGMRLRAIGEALGTSEEAAKNCLFRATRKMRAVIGRFRMTCEWVRNQLALYLYSELPAQEEELVAQHVGGCGGCRKELERERRIHGAMDLAGVRPAPELLERCRLDLSRALLRAEPSPNARSGFVGRVRAIFENGGLGSCAWMRPAGAVALVAVGFFAARFTATAPSGELPGTPGEEIVATQVRHVEPSEAGQVRIVFDETRQRVMSGSLEDDGVRKLLLAAVRTPSEPGVRFESLELLKKQPGSEETRNAMLYAVENDPNDGVRLKALEGLRGSGLDQRSRWALSRVLLGDENPGIRSMAVDMLLQSGGTDIVGTLQELLQREENTYIRGRSQEALRAMKASVETF